MVLLRALEILRALRAMLARSNNGGKNMDYSDKLLRYSMQVSYLKMFLKEELLAENEYEKCLHALEQDYGIGPDILVHK